ncbi:MAG: hypothetical protein LBM73_01250 [Candidatus Nomurabacteria bacterium]|jgi:hypothetical protein|nr:hypothetical protein [Candidatus Nomurabacteria bacterium]
MRGRHKLFKVGATFAAVVALGGGVLLASLSGGQAVHAASYDAANFQDLTAALNSTDSDIDITITANFGITGTVTIPAGKAVSIRSSGNEQYTLQRDSFAGIMFGVWNAGSSLDLTNVVIDGGSQSANATAPMFDVANPSSGTAPVLTVGDGAILQNAWLNPPSSGAAINCFNDANVNVVDGARLTNNYSGGGSAIATNDSCALNITGGKFDGNTATSDGGAILLDSSAPAHIGGTTQIFYNQALAGEGEHGGAISVHDGSSLTIDGNVVISGNHAPTAGGAIDISHDNLSNLTVGKNVTFSGNYTGTFHKIAAADQATYNAQIAATKWSSLASNGYNNYDIAYIETDPSDPPMVCPYDPTIADDNPDCVNPNPTPTPNPNPNPDQPVNPVKPIVPTAPATGWL